MEKIGEFLKQFWMFGVVGMVGIGIMGYGLWGAIYPEQARVEIISGNPSRSDLVGSENGLQPTRSDLLITVDVAGAVEKSGVYKLPSGSRIGDCLVSAGGLAANADREWVAQTLNLAEPIKDGGKIYIPRQSENSENQKVSQSDNKNNKININTATSGELDSLDGIGEVRAQTIIANRPYGSTQELVSKAKIPASVYGQIKDQISVY